MKTIHLIEPHPEQAKGMRVFNAPRPIPGEILWRGVFVQGVFFAGVSDRKLNEYKDGLRKLDACEVKYYSLAEAFERLLNHYRAINKESYAHKYKKLSEEIFRNQFNIVFNR